MEPACWRVVPRQENNTSPRNSSAWRANCAKSSTWFSTFGLLYSTARRVSVTMRSTPSFCANCSTNARPTKPVAPMTMTVCFIVPSNLKEVRNNPYRLRWLIGVSERRLVWVIPCFLKVLCISVSLLHLRQPDCGLYMDCVSIKTCDVRLTSHPAHTAAV